MAFTNSQPPKISIFYTPAKFLKPKPVGRPIILGCEYPHLWTLLQPIAEKQQSLLYGGSLGCIFALSILEQRQQNLFSRPLWVRSWLLFQQNNGKQYSYNTDSRPVHHRQSIATYRPIVGRHIGRLSVDISAESVDRYLVDRGL